MRNQDLSAVGTPLERATSLPAHFYTDPEIYMVEEEVIFRKSWIAIGRIDQLDNAGDYFRFDLSGTPLVATRAKDGEVRVLSAVCLHRFMPVIEGAGNASAFSCPYHLWTYELDGQLIGASEMDKAEGFDKRDCRLPQVRHEVWEGFIFVNLDAEADELAPQLATLREKIKQYRVGEMRTAATMDYESDWNWKVMVENFVESYHHIGVHRNTLEPLFPAHFTTHEDTDGPYVYHHLPTKDRMPMPSKFSIPDDMTEEQRSEILVVNIFPFFLIAIQPDEMNWLQVIPGAAGKHSVRWYICWRRDAFGDPEIESKLARSKAALDAVHREDMKACQAVQQGVSSRYAAPGRLSHLEKGVWQFDQWVREKIAGAS